MLKVAGISLASLHGDHFRGFLMADDTTGWGGTLWAAADLVTPMAVRVAATLRLADHIAAGTRTAEALAQAVDADPDNLDALSIWGVAAAELGRFAEALQPLTRAADNMPPGSVGWVNLTSQLARVLSNVGFWAEAALSR